VDAAVKVADAAPVKVDGVKAGDAAVEAVGAAPVKADGVKAADAVVRAVDADPRVGAAPATAEEAHARAVREKVVRVEVAPRPVPSSPQSGGRV